MRKKNGNHHPTDEQSYTDPIDILKEEHERALHYTAILHNAAERIDKDGFSFESYMEISDVILYIETEIRLHDKKEEDFLFPLLARHLPDPPNVLWYEHRELWSAMSHLRAIVKDVADGNIHGSSIVELVKATKTVADFLKNHIEKENTSLLPEVKKILSAEEYRQLTQEIARATPTQ